MNWIDKLKKSFKEKKENQKEASEKRRKLEKEYETLMEQEEHRQKDLSTPSYLSLRHVNKVYDNYVQAVHDFSLEVNKGEFVVFVGPSGCGKSTTIRMIAGLEELTTGELYLDGKLINDLEPKDRETAMVFQNYALYPHLSVYENMALGLRVQKLKKEEIHDRIMNVAKILDLTDYLSAKPRNLSGGQCQRVALGRAIVKDAKVFLMDEPLSNLDAKLRVAMRSEIIALHRRLGATTIYVTHDQVEAMTMADRIVVMEKGFIKQIGTPEEVYDKPANCFVASFIGSPAMNFLDFVLEGDKAEGKEVSFVLNKEEKAALESKTGFNNRLNLGIRPEDIHLKKTSEGDIPFDGEITLVEMSGKDSLIHFKGKNDEKLIMSIPTSEKASIGGTMTFYFNRNKLHLFDANDGERIL